MEPELSWPDNTNLVHAHKLLEPIKSKYGLGLSWGDLMVLAGTVAIEDMGGPVLGFAAGRIDQVDNSQTNALGPSEEQERFKHIEIDGMAEAPLGHNTMGLIYVNPAGPMGVPNPQGAADVRYPGIYKVIRTIRVHHSHTMFDICSIFLSPDHVSLAESDPECRF
jgi:catalase-peroxidase